jgi:hypothetical protein
VRALQNEPQKIDAGRHVQEVTVPASFQSSQVQILDSDGYFNVFFLAFSSSAFRQKPEWHQKVYHDYFLPCIFQFNIR